ncbi:MAG: hypothetical protein J1E35_03970 [Lachnospiraceae bacterium]|nr:hypothetical protein [Lachnospiraceae bacterium]
MKVKAFKMLVIAAIILAVPYTALAAEECDDFEKKVEVVEYELTSEMETEKYVSDEKLVTPRSSSKPNLFHDLSERYYVLSFPNVTEYTYSLVYFKPDSLGRVSIYTNTIESEGKRIAIRLYQKSGDICVSSWYGDPQPIRGLGYSNLQASENYYFKFEVYEASSINGIGYIHYPDNSIPVD